MEGALNPTRAFRDEDIARDSAGLGWSLLRLEHRMTPAGGEGAPIAFAEDVLIVHRRESRMWQEIDGRAAIVTFRPGDALLVPRGAPVRWRWSGPAETIVLGLDPADRAPRPHLTDWRLAAAAGRLLAAAVPGAGPLLADGLALRLLDRLAGPPPGPGRDRPLDERRLRIATGMMAEGLTGVAVADLAAAVGLSPAHFARAFRARTGVPPHGWAASLRLDRALDALARPGRSLAEVALDAGFADQAHMTREVRRATGLTPGALRR